MMGGLFPQQVSFPPNVYGQPNFYGGYYGGAGVGPGYQGDDDISSDDDEDTGKGTYFCCFVCSHIIIV
jgi:hypothetical protein